MVGTVKLSGIVADIDTSSADEPGHPAVVLVLDCGEELFRVIVKFPQVVLLGSGARIGQRVIVEGERVFLTRSKTQEGNSCVVAGSLRIDSAGLN